MLFIVFYLLIPSWTHFSSLLAVAAIVDGPILFDNSNIKKRPSMAAEWKKLGISTYMGKWNTQVLDVKHEKIFKTITFSPFISRISLAQASTVGNLYGPTPK